MEAVLLIATLAIAVWGFVYLWRGSLLAGCLATLVAGYILTNNFWKLDLGPVSLNAGRALLILLGTTLLWRWRQGLVNFGSITKADWLTGLFVGYVAFRFVTTSYPPALEGTVDPFWRLIECFCVPMSLYLVGRNIEFSERSWKLCLVVLSVLGTYLAVTALAEVTSQWWAVFPRFISDPNLGTHFGRARGPALNSVSLGVYLTICFWAAWQLWPQVSRPWRLALVGTLGLMCLGTYFTYTRSAWLALAFTLAVIPLLQVPRSWRPVVIGTLLIAGLFGTVLVGGKLVNLDRQDSDASAGHSVYQRQSFLLVSSRMFADQPLFGCGFGRFYDKKLPYLADRSQQLELESIRNLDHHNTFLSLLTETGLIGLSLFVAALIAWCRTGWSLFRNAENPDWLRQCGLLTLVVMAVYCINGMFHDLSLLPSEQWMLFFMAGASIGWALRQEAGDRRQESIAPSEMSGSFLPTEHGLLTADLPQVRIFGIKIDRINMSAAVEKVWRWCREEKQSCCRYVVTPNVDHVVMYQTSETLRRAYASASLVLADGAPVVWASRLLVKALPERVAGSDLVPAIFDHATNQNGQRPLRVFLLGAAPGVAVRAAKNIHRRWSNVQVVGTYSPPIGFEHDQAENQKILDQVASAQADLLLVGLGAPKQEQWVSRYASQLQVQAALCIGATIDFLAGEKSRCPRWMRSVGLEWLHRLASEPKRLAKRYLRDAWIFPQLVWQELLEWTEGRAQGTEHR